MPFIGAIAVAIMVVLIAVFYVPQAIPIPQPTPSGTTTNKITDTIYNDQPPDMSATHIVFARQYTLGNPESTDIILMDRSNMQETRITSDGVRDYNPHVHGDYVAWIRAVANVDYLFTYKISTQQIVDTGLRAANCNIYGDNIVYVNPWQTLPLQGTRVYCISNTTSWRIGGMSQNYGILPGIYGTTVVYTSQSDVYRYDISTSTTTKLTSSNATFSWIEAFCDTNGQMWAADGAAGQTISYRPIMFYGWFANGTYEPLSYLPNDPLQPKTWGGKISTRYVAYMQSDTLNYPVQLSAHKTVEPSDFAGNTDIYAWDWLNSNSITISNDTSANEVYPDINGEDIVYMSDADGDFDLYLWSKGGSTPPINPNGTVSPTSDDGGSITSQPLFFVGIIAAVIAIIAIISIATYANRKIKEVEIQYTAYKPRKGKRG